MARKKWKKLYDMQVQFVCPYCLGTFPMTEASKDHEPPKSRQAELGPSKLVLCCKHCNHEKGALTAAQYAEWKTLREKLRALDRVRNGVQK